MSNENERQEYVLNENGIIFVGNARYIEARGWYYGQVSHKEFVWTLILSPTAFILSLFAVYLIIAPTWVALLGFAHSVSHCPYHLWTGISQKGGTAIKSPFILLVKPSIFLKMYLIWPQFQDLLNICLTMLDLSLYYRQDPAMDVSRRGDPKYLGRVISSMVRNGKLNPNPTGVSRKHQWGSAKSNKWATYRAVRQFTLCLLPTGLSLDQWKWQRQWSAPGEVAREFPLAWEPLQVGWQRGDPQEMAPGQLQTCAVRPVLGFCRCHVHR